MEWPNIFDETIDIHGLGMYMIHNSYAGWHQLYFGQPDGEGSSAHSVSMRLPDAWKWCLGKHLC